MSIVKRGKDQLIKFLLGKSAVPQGLVELFRYTKNYGPINFTYKNEGNLIIAISTNYRYGSIVTSGNNEKDLDNNIKDAILTSFEIPSSYASEARIHKLGDAHLSEYAPA